ncbi:hypothetical protein, partial [Anaerotignum lactatifermentans]|uniref:hypothetical protein n=1 Tax=Anaerotignum lactatifermentans TaxID=160404 RepID=UPI001A9B00D3
IVSTTSCLNSGVYRLFGTPFGIKITPLVIQYIILSNKWGAVHYKDFSFFVFTGFCQICFFLKGNLLLETYLFHILNLLKKQITH